MTYSFHVECCIRQLRCPSTTSYNITSIAYNQYTDIHSQTYIHTYIHICSWTPPSVQRNSRRSSISPYLRTCRSRKSPLVTRHTPPLSLIETPMPPHSPVVTFHRILKFPTIPTIPIAPTTIRTAMVDPMAVVMEPLGQGQGHLVVVVVVVVVAVAMLLLPRTTVCTIWVAVEGAKGHTSSSSSETFWRRGCSRWVHLSRYRRCEGLSLYTVGLVFHMEWCIR